MRLSKNLHPESKTPTPLMTLESDLYDPRVFPDILVGFLSAPDTVMMHTDQELP